MKTTPSLRNFLLGSALFAAVTATAHAAALIWDGGGSPSINWNLGTNWDTNATPITTSDITFNNTVTGPLSTTMGAAYTVNSLNFTSAQTSSVIINTDNTKALTIGGGAATDISVQAGSHTFIGTNGGSGTAGDLFFTNATTNIINIADTASLTIQARIRNVSGNTVTMQKTGLGTLVLSGNNGGTGGWTLSNAFAIQGGVLRFAAASAYGNSGNQYTVSSGAALELSGGGNQSNASGTITLNGTGIGGAGALRSLSGTNGITNAGSIVLNTVGDNSIGVDADTLSIANVISGTSSTRNFTKVGAGILTLTNTNTYSGTTTITAGTLAVSSTGSISNTTAINVAAGAKFVYNSSTALTVAPTLNGSGSNKATFSGSGTINAAMTLNSVDDVISPGNSPGTQVYGASQTWSSFSYDWELNDWNNTVAGTNIDQIQITGTLDLSATLANQYVLNIFSLNNASLTGLVGASGGNTFSEVNRSWTILTSTGLTGFSESEWSINTAGFSDAETGTWAISQSGNNLLLTYTAIPEPGAALLGSLGMLALLRRRRA